MILTIKDILILLAVLSLLLTISHQSQAQTTCIYNGQHYNEGTRIGPYICSNGKWILQN